FSTLSTPSNRALVLEATSRFSEEESGPESDNSFTDAEIWRPSPSPEETFSDAEGADGNGNWEVQIIGEEVDSQGNIRYEVRRSPSLRWTRADGTNTTWDNDLIHPDDIKPWKKAQSLRRAQLAEESLDIEVWATMDIHNTNTRLRAQAYEEKLRKRQQNPLNLREKMLKLMEEKKPDWGGVDAGVGPGPSRNRLEKQVSSSSKPESSRASVASARYSTVDLDDADDSRASSTRSKSKMKAPNTPARPASSISVSSSTRSHGRGQTADSVASTSTSNRSSTLISSIRCYTPASSVSSVTLSRSTPSSSKGKGKATADDSPRLMRPLPARARTPVPPPPPRRRRKLQQQWTSIAKACGAAQVTIVNEVDDEEVPDLPPEFKYIESEYRYSNKVRRPDDDDADYFIRCECEECELATTCGCQGPSDLEDKYGNKVYAYTAEGLFAFNVPRGIEVVECNRYCSCDPTDCPNRVAQQPRDVPIEIFKTNNRGWGARAPVDIEKGKVLGIYTGLLIRRDAAEAQPDDERSYCFDLDGREDPEHPTPDEVYSVDSRVYGNWTRFINHSCSPNLRIYLVVYDTIPEMNMPYLAFVATEDITARTEFTFDYDPAAASKTKGKGKGKVAIPEGAKPCMCGAPACRGWVRV
ncbi:Histone-lysine N-methyltransferase, H3 lysine-9 specific, partial [Hypsizygus marmoreus]